MRVPAMLCKSRIEDVRGQCLECDSSHRRHRCIIHDKPEFHLRPPGEVARTGAGRSLDAVLSTIAVRNAGTVIAPANPTIVSLCCKGSEAVRSCLVSRCLGGYVFLPDGFLNWALPECSILNVRIIRSGPMGRAEGCQTTAEARESFVFPERCIQRPAH